MTKITLNAGNLVFSGWHVDAWDPASLAIWSPLRLIEDTIWDQVQTRIAPTLCSQIRLQTAAPVDGQLDLHGQLIWADQDFNI